MQSRFFASFFRSVVPRSVVMAGLLTILSFAGPLAAHADEGMWLPLYLEKLNHARMQALGLQLPADEVFSNDKNSLKDAIVWFNGGCTAEVISKNGLILTNHHCGFTEIANHSTLQHNYLQDGFWAQNYKEELPNPGLTVSFVRSMTNVTKNLLEGLDPYNLSDADKTTLRSRVADLTKQLNKEDNKGTEVLIRPMYYGTEYYAFVLETFRDVRLVGAPPSGVGKFGGDTDNWMWPRHTGDFSIFRIYANKNNQSATYSAENVPYQPQRSLTISVQGIQPGDFTMVYGFPGRTQEYISSYQLQLITEVQNKYKINLRTQRLKVIDAAMASAPSLRLMYADAQATIANAWKKWQGENKGVARLKTLDAKLKEESRFADWASSNSAETISNLVGHKRNYAEVVPSLARWTDSLRTVALATDYYREAILGNGLLNFATTWEDALKSMRKVGGQAPAPDKVASRLKSLAAQNKEYYPQHDEAVERQLLAICLRAYYQDISPAFHTSEFQKLVKEHDGDFDKLAAELYRKSLLANATTAKKGLQMLLKGDTSKISKDPALVLFRAFNRQYTSTLVPRYQRFSQQLETATGLMLEGNRAKNKEKSNIKYYPDANSTLRVAYGQVNGYSPQDGVQYKHYTTLDGVVAKHNPDIEEFNVPKGLLDLHASKDYGRYAVNGTVPVAFTASNHTTGGNSGSPVLDARGRLIGTNFDRCWEGTMSDLQYDKDQCRNIVLDVRYTLFIIEKLGRCQSLIDEMNIE